MQSCVQSSFSEISFHVCSALYMASIHSCYSEHTMKTVETRLPKIIWEQATSPPLVS